MLDFFSIKKTISADITNTIASIYKVRDFLLNFIEIEADYFIESEYQLPPLIKSLLKNIITIDEHLKTENPKKKFLLTEIKTCRKRIDNIFKVLLTCTQFEKSAIDFNLDLINSRFFNLNPDIKDSEDTIVRLFKNKHNDNNLKLKLALIKNKEEIVNVAKTLLNDNSTALVHDVIVDKMIAYFMSEFEKMSINAELNIDLLLRYQKALKNSNLGYIVGLQITIIDNIYEAMSHRSQLLEKRQELILPSKENIIMLPAEDNKLQFYADTWQILMKTKENEAIGLIKYFIDFVFQSNNFKYVRQIDHPIEDLDTFALFLIKIPNLAKDQQQKIINEIVNFMSVKVFDLINAHFRQEKGPAGRENSIVAGIITNLVLDNDKHVEFILKSIKPILKILGASFEDSEEIIINGNLEAIFIQACVQLCTISNYPSEIQRIIYDFSTKKPDELIGYLSTRIINPVILNQMSNLKNESLKPYLKIIMYALQGLGAIECKKGSYQTNIANDTILELVYNKIFLQELKETCTQSISGIELDKLLLNINFNDDNNFELKQTTVNCIKDFNKQFEFTKLEKCLIPLAQAVKLDNNTNHWSKYKNTYPSLSFEQKAEVFENCLKEMKCFLFIRLEIKESKSKTLDEIAFFKHWLVFLCHSFTTWLPNENASLSISDLDLDKTTNFEGLIRAALLELVDIKQQKSEEQSFCEENYILLSEKMSLPIYTGLNQKDILKLMIKKTCTAILEKFEDTQRVKVIEIDEQLVERWKILNNDFKIFKSNYKNKFFSDIKTITEIGLLARPTNQESYVDLGFYMKNDFSSDNNNNI
jgi:hypothetical protein